VGAPLGVVLDQQWGLASIGLAIMLLCAAAWLWRAASLHSGDARRASSLPPRDVPRAPHGMALALGGVGYSVLATFVTLFYASRHWGGAALCLTAFGVAFIAARLLFIRTINRFGGFAVSMACMSVESLGMVLLWRAHSPWMALTAAALTGFGFSLVFPALGVEAVKRVPAHNRGTALASTRICRRSFFLVGPLAGAVIGGFGYASAFLFGLVCVLGALAIVMVLRQMQESDGAACAGSEAAQAEAYFAPLGKCSSRR